MYALIRPSSHDPKEILRCLELGVDGICIPQVQSVEQQRKLSIRIILQKDLEELAVLQGRLHMGLWNSKNMSITKIQISL